MNKGRGNYLIDVGSFSPNEIFIYIPQHVCKVYNRRARQCLDWLEYARGEMSVAEWGVTLVIGLGACTGSRRAMGKTSLCGLNVTRSISYLPCLLLSGFLAWGW